MAAGAGGDLTIETPDLVLSGHGIINANTLGHALPDAGPAGNILLNVDRLHLTDGGAVTASSSSQGDGRQHCHSCVGVYHH